MSDFDASTTAIDDITGDYTLDPAHTRLGFIARHAMVTKVRGQFKDFSGTAHIDTANPSASKVELTIQADSVDTGVADRDAHLRSNDFFGTDETPALTFTSTAVERDGAEWTITGDLAIKGITHSITIPFAEVGSAQDPFGNTRLGFEGSTTINRGDWGLSFNAALETGGVLVSDKIKLEFDVSGIKNAA